MADMTSKATLPKWQSLSFTLNVDLRLPGRSKQEPLADRVVRSLEPYLEVCAGRGGNGVDRIITCLFLWTLAEPQKSSRGL